METAMDEETLRERIERMVAIRERMNVGRDELNDLRREARADGVNIQALNPLVDVLAEHQYDQGSRVLSDLVYYAQVAGTELPVQGDGASAAGVRARDSAHGPATQTRVSAPPPSAPLPETRRWPFSSLGLAFKGVLAGSISFLLVWFLH